MDIEFEEKAPVRVPFPTVLASIVGLWVCYFVLITLRSLSLEFNFEDEMVWRRALVCLAGAVTMLGFWLILRLFDDRPLWTKIAAALVLSLPVSLILAQTNVLVFASVEEKAYRAMAEQQGFEVRRDSSGDLLVEVSVPDASGDASKARAVTIGRKSTDMNVWQSLAEIGFGRYFMLLAWCALYLAFLTGEKARTAERREGEFRRAAKAAELRSLRYQVNPHFLFNTLNSLSSLVLTGKTAAAERMIQTMSTFYRRSLADDPTVDVSLDEEFALQRLYLDIETARFPERLEAKFDLPEALGDAHIPGMILQPLVENSVKHAVAPSHGKVTISISAREEYGRLVVTVADNGGGLGKNHEPRPGYGIGLRNVEQRLAARFGDEATIVSGPSSGGYATHLRLPLVGVAKAAA
ncbi:sensor histidine kinase [Altererythrobacter salegens]|uniref:Sensor histidine kinase n=1 Tax=Croceibacterium salegens TaxID=1737568 RepID=A0A6I4SX89_9SPHN|nr:histidine kinase [Croceibacterium salegens]MXO60473.1 sensor histidine kinase [Croceibacterium salegens]